MARTYKVAAAHALHHDRKAKGKVAEKQQLLNLYFSDFEKHRASAFRFGNDRHSVARSKVIGRRIERAQAREQHRRDLEGAASL